MGGAIGGLAHDGKCRYRERRPMGNGVLYVDGCSIWIAESTREPGKGVEQKRSICVLEGLSGVVQTLTVVQFWPTLGIKVNTQSEKRTPNKSGRRNQVSFFGDIFKHFPRES